MEACLPATDNSLFIVVHGNVWVILHGIQERCKRFRVLTALEVVTVAHSATHTEVDDLLQGQLLI